uniref:Uncharacterized protein n=1 Tax=Ralstonia solanacearum TaxID=305 RepID=A0A0S4TNS7_RALSL|nr:conserved protein of unknown function [Ralstonia solanacearum]
MERSPPRYPYQGISRTIPIYESRKVCRAAWSGPRFRIA